MASKPKEPIICSLCSETITTDSFVTKCHHTFHQQCLDENQRFSHNCPTCNTLISGWFAPPPRGFDPLPEPHLVYYDGTELILEY